MNSCPNLILSQSVIIFLSFVCVYSEILFEQKDFVERELAALVASKVYYHLGAFDESLTFALGAGQKLDVNGSSEYVETIICKKVLAENRFVSSFKREPLLLIDNHADSSHIIATTKLKSNPKYIDNNLL